MATTKEDVPERLRKYSDDLYALARTVLENRQEDGSIDRVMVGDVVHKLRGVAGALELFKMLLEEDG